ncbi:DEAD box protein 52 homolog isoform X2 [Cylas formicarius]|uniref:DEAD box protein 52 homolog isoform X2 n=1 Tax=Cylas formicarius TaxID=197179 RepID=UPI002958A76D|nr:DEAD box protein 52 homolog isoform X2 [Cylas formicarius]
MDAYDIFKKLTNGLHFPKDQPKRIVKKEIALEVDSGDQSKESNHNTTVTILNGITSQQKRGKKRKLLDENEILRRKKLLEKEEVNRYRNMHGISVVGKNLPAPARSFNDFLVDQDIIENLKMCGYEEPTSIQKQAVPILLQGRQLLACAPTGSGKTAAFLIPIIQKLKRPRKKGFRALILCPTYELARQTQRECIRLSEGRGFRIHIISKIKKTLSQYGPSSNKGYDILITTPNRLCFLLKQDPPILELSNIEWLIVDEADKLYEEGKHSFRYQLISLLAACNNVNRKIAMFSATFTPALAKWCVRNMKGLARVTVGNRNTAVDTVEQRLLFVGNEQGKLIAIRDLIRQGINPPVLVFVQSRDRAQQLFKELIYDGVMVAAMHADMTQTQRYKTVEAFREGQVWVLICTELMARGVDFKGVNLVINYDFPPSVISYVHRIGRAGRAGRKGKAVTFFTSDDRDNLKSPHYQRVRL